jgi:V8-like Glu-specific endopeptidase
MWVKLKTKWKSKNAHNALIAFTLVTLNSCGKKLFKETGSTTECNTIIADDGTNEEQLNLVNGVQTTEHPAVGLIIQRISSTSVESCTGTFVSSSAMVTAAHCIGSTPNGNISFYPGAQPNWQKPDPKPIAATKVFHLGKTKEDFDKLGPNPEPVLEDIAIILFPEGTAPAALGLTTKRPPVDQTVTLVGFGSTHKVGSSNLNDYVIARRAGTNKIKLFPDYPEYNPGQIMIGFITELQSTNAKGSLAVASNGDSGGPMISDGLLAGVSSTSAIADPAPGILFSSYTSVNSPEAVRLFAAAKAGGANIPALGEKVTLTNPAAIPTAPAQPVPVPAKKTTSNCAVQ